MITIREFVEKVYNKRVANQSIEGGIDGNKDYQCVELIYFYLQEVFGLKKSNYLGDGKYNVGNLVKNYGFEKISKNEIPKRGDVVSFGETKTNSHGHVAIILGATKDFIYVLEQNAGLGKQEGLGRDASIIRKKTYNNVLGFARYKNISEVVEKDLFDKIIFENGDYFFEDTKETKVKRRNAVKGIYFIFNGNFDGWEQVGITKNLDDAVIRRDFAYMLRGYLKNVRGVEVSYDDLINKYNVWSGSRGDDFLTPFELTVMLKNMKKIFG